MRQKGLILISIIVSLFISCKKEAKDSLASLTTIESSNVTANTLQTGGDILNSGGSTIVKKGICFAIHSLPTISDSVIVSEGMNIGKFNVSLNNLASYTTYYIRSYAINSQGVGYGNEISVRTSPGLATLKTTAISDILQLSAKSGGLIISNGGTPVTSRGVCWSLSSNPTIENNKTVDSNGIGIFISTLNPLGSQLHYYVRAYAINGFGVSYGNEIEFQSVSGNAVTDLDGNSYPYITIGNQTWMTVNLRTTHYSNGDTIINGYANDNLFYKNWYNHPSNPQSTHGYDTVGAYSYPNNDTLNNMRYGKYYDVISMTDSRGVCPIDWHVPTDNDWKILEVYEGMSQADADFNATYVGRGMIGAKFLKGGSSGLNLELAGMLFFDFEAGPTFLFFGDKGRGYYWASTPVVQGGIDYWFREFNYQQDSAPIIRATAHEYAMSIRCIKN